MQEIRLQSIDIQRQSKQNLKEDRKILGSEKWKDVQQKKKKMDIYILGKDAIKEEDIYDNRPHSIILFRA